MKKFILISISKNSVPSVAKDYFKQVFIFLTLLISFQFVKGQDQNDVKLLNDAVKNLTEVIVHDVYTPPAASRIYAYAAIAAYEVIQQGSDSFPSFYGLLNEMPFIHESDGQINYTLAGLLAYYHTAQIFLSSYTMLDPFIDTLLNHYRSILSEKEIIASQLWGKMTAMKMMSWANEDRFKEIHTLPRYELINTPYAWQPTPPDFADPVEPYWGTLRLFALDSVEIIAVDPHDPFSTDSNSQFYAGALKIYRIGNELSEEQKKIAEFWDDNPYTTKYAGHLQFGVKKISPAGHWMDITRIAIEQSGCDLFKAIQAYACVSIAMADGFICCWAEKYKSNLIRPETFINRYIDEGWKPYLQTPPFPEHTSGHSVISTAASTILTRLFGDHVAFSDQIETAFGLPARHFNSFQDAALEASYSRIFAGIHFEKGVEAGVAQGQSVAHLVIEKLLNF